MFDLYVDGMLVESFFDRESAMLAAHAIELAGKEWAILSR